MLFAALCLSVALPQSTDRISHDSSAGQANSHSYGAQISANGRFVAFQSEASDLVPADTNAAWDIFLRDTVSGMTTRVSVSSFGTQGNHDSTSPAISADGRFITFQSKASNLVAVDSNNRDDIFVHDMKTGLTENVSVSSAGVQSNGVSYAPRISADGRFVVFPCEGNNLVAGDTNGFTDVFRYD
ncbi:MAG: PD40 domain-containing protein [Planctomycetes bacterium]|nr:PD40 domain-containing protein [Planctomycetota bacterium]